MLWWLAQKTQIVADAHPSAPCFEVGVFDCSMPESVVHTKKKMFFKRYPMIPSCEDVVLQVLSTCLFGVQRMVEIMDMNGLILEPLDALEASDCLHLHLRCYSWLALFFYDLRQPLFKMRPKCHYLWHQAQDLQSWKLNLNMFHTFGEESLLGKIKTIAQKVHGRTMSQRTFQRYLLFVAVFLHENRN